MTDERLGRIAGAWLQDTEEPAPDPQGIVLGAMAHVPQVCQIHASGIRAHLEREVVPVPGVLRPATDHHVRRGGSSMSASLRFVVAAVVLLATGGLLFAVVWQPSTDEAVAPVPATSSAPPQPTATSESPMLTTAGSADDGVFELAITTPQATWTADEPIEVGATFAYVGDEEQRVITTAYGGAVAFRIEQLDGPFATEVFRRSSCESHTYPSGEIETIQFAKSGGFDAASDDAAFWRSWFEDPDLRLAAGTYRIVAEARYGPPGCGETSQLEAAITIEVVESTSEGIKATSDLKAIAEANGWTIDQAKAQQAVSRGIAGISSAVFEEQPDIYIGAAMAEEPGGAPSLYIKGPAPQWVLDLVAEADGPIIVVDEQPYSFDELDARKDRVHQALVDAGYPNVATGVNITGGGVIPVSLLTVAGLPSDPEGILALVPEELRADVQLDVTIAPPRPTAEPGAWGPLAVVYQPAGFGPGVGLGAVTLRIGETCAWIESKQGRYRTTLVFEGDHVDWRPADRHIVFTDRRGETVRLSDGDRIEGGGVGLWPPQGPEGEVGPAPTPEPGRRWDPLLDEAWLQEPDPSCPERLFFLSEVTVLKGR